MNSAWRVWSLAGLAGVVFLSVPARAETKAEKIRAREADNGRAKRKFRFRYQAFLKDIPAGTQKLELWIPVPQSTKHQKISKVAFPETAPAQVAVEPEHGNKIAYWKFEGAALKPRALTMTFECQRKEISAKKLDKARSLKEEERAALAAYLKGGRLVPVGQEIQAVADRAVDGAHAPLAVGKAAYDYVLRNMRYSKQGRGWGRGSTQWACTKKYGNCTDFHALFMSIGRTKGVPVKFEMGFPLPGPAVHQGRIGGYHCWAKFYLGGLGWAPVDISEAWKHKELAGYYFGNLSADRVQMTSGRDLNLVPRQAGAPLNYFIYPYAEADGKPFKVTPVFSFVDLDPKRSKTKAPTHPKKPAGQKPKDKYLNDEELDEIIDRL